jgi:Rps23 Pro-64 3,4-dihydroxylase Tpa1-like proline 4-hydroxylase
MKDRFVELIQSRLLADEGEFRRKFESSGGEVARHVAIDNLLPAEITEGLYEKFPARELMRSWSDLREKKFTMRDMDKVDSDVFDVISAFHDQRVITTVENIIGIEGLLPDPTFYAGGLSAMEKGCFLNPHLDNSHDANRELYRRVNLLFYITPGWEKSYGGNLELWDRKVKNPVEIVSLFNRLVLMETNSGSWHSVNRVAVDKRRCCVSNYYFSEESPTGFEYFHITRFNGRPEQKARRLFMGLDGFARTMIRRFVKKGIGRNDSYKAG